MLNDAAFRILLLDRKYNDFVEAWNKASFPPDQKDALRKFFLYVNELSRIVTKEEGQIVQRL